MAECFVIGPPKTGTTLLTRLLYQHPDVDGLSESLIMTADHVGSILNLEGDKWAKHGLTADFIAELPMSKSDAPRVQDYRDTMEALWDGCGVTCQVRCDSWPKYAEHLATVNAAFPAAKYLCTVRDPRAVFLSGDTYRDREIGLHSVIGMMGAIETIRDFSDRADVMMLRYEDLVCHPDRIIEQVWDFVGVDPSKGWIDYDASKDWAPGRWDWIPNSTAAPDRARIDRWKKELAKEDLEAVEAVAAKLMADFGYERVTDVETVEQVTLEKWIRGESIAQLGDGAEELVRKTANQHADILANAITGVDAIERLSHVRANEILGKPHPTPEAAAFGHGALHGCFEIAQAIGLLREWIIMAMRDD